MKERLNEKIKTNYKNHRTFIYNVSQTRLTSTGISVIIRARKLVEWETFGKFYEYLDRTGKLDLVLFVCEIIARIKMVYV